MAKNILQKMVVLMAIVLLTACENVRFNESSPIPSMPVSYTLNIMQDAPLLTVAGGYYEITEITDYNQYIGYGGLLVFHGFDDTFYAYDMSCPYECATDTLIVASMVGTAVCSHCGSTYDVGFGSGYPSEGPSEYPLRQYTVRSSGYYLYISQ